MNAEDVTIDEMIELIQVYLDGRLAQLPEDANYLAKQIFASEGWQKETDRQIRILSALLATLQQEKMRIIN
jgi:hypothetical protein